MIFVYKFKSQWLPSAKDYVHVCIFTKSKNMCNVFIYKNPDTLPKAIQFALRFYIQKNRHFTLRGFHEILEVGIYIQKVWYFALRDISIYKKPDTSQKARQFVLFFLIQKSGHFAFRDLSLHFWNWWRGGDIFLCKKQCTLRYIFICKRKQDN